MSFLSLNAHLAMSSQLDANDDARDAEIARLQAEVSLLTENASLRKQLWGKGGGKGGRGGAGRGGASSKGGRQSKPESTKSTELSPTDAVIAIVKVRGGTCLLSSLGAELKKLNLGYGDHPKLRDLVESIAQLKVEGTGPRTTAIIRKDDRAGPSDPAGPSEE